MVICLECNADLHMALLMPLPLTVSCFSKIQIGFTFLVPAHLGSPGQRAVKRVCVCDNFVIIIVIIVVASLHHHVHGRQHASRGLQSDKWNRFVAGRASCSVDDQVGDATCGQEVG